MADNGPLDDAPQAAVAAAAARMVETIGREARDQAAQHRATLERTQDQQRAPQVLAGLSTVYDRPAERQARDRARVAAGVPVNARRVRATADLMNGNDRAKAAVRTQPEQPAGQDAASSAAPHPRGSPAAAETLGPDRVRTLTQTQGGV